MSASVWDRIETGRRRWDVLRHPFYRRWSQGALSPAELARYSGQYRHAVEAIAALSATLADALPARDGLRGHAAEERDHVRLWDGFVEAAGGAPASPNAETAACIEAWTAPGESLELLARLYAIETTQPAISATKREGLLERYGFEDGAGTAYFRVHASRDVEHAAEVRALGDDLCGAADTDRMVAAAESALRANWRLLDGVV